MRLISPVVARSGECTAAQGACTQRYDYDRDEVGRLMRARRSDFADSDVAPVGAPRPSDATYPALPAQATAADLAFTYDAANNRVVEAESHDNAAPTYQVEIFDSLRLNHAAWQADDYQHDASTETVYLLTGGTTLARVVPADPDLPAPVAGKPHVYLMLGDHLGSTSTVIDRATNEVVERGTYVSTKIDDLRIYANGKHAQATTKIGYPPTSATSAHAEVAITGRPGNGRFEELCSGGWNRAERGPRRRSPCWTR